MSLSISNGTSAQRGAKVERFPFIQASVLVILAFLLYAGTLNHKYALDDALVIEKHQHASKGLAGISKILSTPRIYGKRINDGLYRPLALVTHAVEFQFFGANPMIGHLVNILLYSLTAFVLFVVLRDLFVAYDPIFPFLASLIFVAHPIHTEVVANIKSRDELLCFLFALATVYFLFRFIRRNHYAMLLASSLSYVAALLSKESGIVFLAVIPLCLFFFTRCLFRDIVKYSIPFLLITAIWLGIRESVLAPYAQFVTQDVRANPLFAADLALPTAIDVVRRYLLLLVFPYPLVCDYSAYGIPVIPFYNVRAIFSLVSCLLLLGYASYYIAKRDVVSFGILYFFITISAVSNIFILIGTIMAERLLYAPSLGFAVVLAHLILRLTDKYPMGQVRGTHKCMIMIIPIVTVYAVLTVNRNVCWEDNGRLFLHDIRYAPNNAFLANGVGLSLHNDKKDYVAAKPYFQKAIEIYPDFYGYHSNLAANYERLGKYDLAIQSYKRAIDCAPRDAQLYVDLGKAYGRMEDYVLSFEYLDKAVALDSRNPDALFNLGLTFLNMKNPGEAVKCFTKTIELQPTYPDVTKHLVTAYKSLGKKYFELKEYEQSLDCFHKWQELDPQDYLVYRNLGAVYLLTEHYDSAIENLRRALSMEPEAKDVIRYLAIAYEKKGKNVEAQEYRNRLR